MRFSMLIDGRFLLGCCLALVLAGCDRRNNHQADNTPAPDITAISPNSGSFGTLVTLSGSHFASSASDNRVKIVLATQGTLTVTPVSVTSDSVQFIMPSAIPEIAQVSVTAHAKQSVALEFIVTGFTDPTPDQPASEFNQFFSTLDDALNGINGALANNLEPLMAANGQSTEAQLMHEALLAVRQGFSQFALDRFATLTSEQMAAYDAFFASEAGVQVVQLFNQVSEKLQSQIVVASAGKVQAQAISIGGLDSSALESIREVKQFIRDLRDLMNELDDALFAAEIGLGASTVVFEGAPALIAVLEDIRQTVVNTIIDVLNVVLVILDSVPTDAVGGTLEIEIASNDLYLNQDFGSMEEPISEARNPGHMLVLEPYGLKGTIDFSNGGSQSLNEKIEELVGEISAVAAALLEFADFEIDEIVAEKVEIKLRLVTSQPSTFSGSWGSNQLTLTALQPGEGLVTIQGDLDQIVADGEPCPVVLGGISGECIHESDLQVSRTMKAYAGIQTEAPFSQGALLLTAQVDGLAPNQGYIGDTLHVTGEGFSTDPQLAHQDLYFGDAIPEIEGSTGLAWSIHEDNNTFTSLDVEIPDALSGPLNVSIESHPSNVLNFTILPPLLEQPPVSAIVGEAWPGADGRGFSHSLSRNEGDWNGGRTHPFAPAAADYSLGNEAAHHHLEFIVPEDAQSGPFKIVTLGSLESNAFDVAVRKFAPPIALSALDRPGFRPVVARDSSDGRRIVAWIDHSNSGGNQLVTSVIESSATTFTTPVVVASNIGGLAGAPPKPAVAAANGKLYVAWVGSVAGNDEILLASSSDGLTWSAPVNLSNSSDRSSLQPTLSADGELVALAWIEEGVDEGDDAALKFRISNNGGTNFGNSLSPAGAGDTTDPALIVQGQTIAVAWAAVVPGKRDLFVQRSDNGGASFSGVWYAANNAAGGIARHPSLALGDSCVTPGVKSIYLAWENASGGNLEEEVYLARWDGSDTEYTAPVNISNSTSYSRSPVITVDADCIPALAWIEQGLSRDTIIQNGISRTFQALPSTLYFARSFDNGATFNKPVMQLQQNNDGERIGHLAMIGSEHAYFTLVYQNDSGAVGAAPPHIVLRTTEGEPNAPAAQPAATTIEANQDLIYHGSLGIYAATVDGRHRQKVSRDLGSQHTIGLSPDGRWLAFLPGYDRLIVAEADGAYPMLVASTRDAVLRGGAVWSLDDAYVGVACYWSECSGFDKVTAWVKPDSTDFELLFDGFTGQQPWSPEGQMIFSGSGVFTKDPVTNERIELTLDPALPAGQQVYYPAWSPDGAHIAFIASPDASVNWEEGRYGYGDLYVMNADGSEVRRLVSNGDALTPFWSPDNRTIGFVSNRLSGNDHRHVFVTDLSGVPLSEIDLASNVLAYDDVMPFFLPDGSGVVVLRTDSGNDNKKSLVTIDVATLTASDYAPASLIMGPGSALHLGTRPLWPDGATASNDTPGATSVGLNWSDASDDQGAVQYQIYNGSTMLAVVSDGSSYNVSGLEPDTTYTLTIIPCDAAGNCALAGQSVTFTTAADSSGDVTAPVWEEAFPTLVREMDWYDAIYQVYLSWTGATDDSPVTYVLYSNGVELARFDDNSFVTVNGFRPSTDYLVTLQACDSEDNCTTDGPSYAFSTVADTTELRLNSVQVLVDELTLDYDDPLNDAFVPAPGDFVVTVNGTSVAVDSVALHADEKEVVLTLADTVYAGDTVLFSYDPGTFAIQDFGANKADSETNHTVYNAAMVVSEAIAADADGNAYVAGYFEGAAKFGTHALNAAGHGDAYIAKRNVAGQWLWALRAGGTGWDASYGLALDAEHVYLTGAFTGEGSFGDETITANGAADLFVAKLDLNGQWIWSTRAGGAPAANEYTGIPGDAFNGMPFVEVANSVAVDGSGNVYVAGKFIGSASFGDSGLGAVSEDSTNIVVAKLNASGAWQWAASAGGTGYDWANGVAVDGTGVYVTGAASANSVFGSDTLLNSGLFVAKLDVDDGVWQWADQGSSLAGVGSSVLTNGAGEVYVAGNNSAVVINGFLAQPFVGHWSSAGALQWLQTATGSYGFASGLTLNADGYLYTSGVNGGTLNFDSISITDSGTFIAKMSTDGAWQWVLAGGGNDSKGIASCGLSAMVCAIGLFSNSATFGVLPTIYSPQNIYIVKAGNAVEAEPVGEWLSLGSTAD